MICRKLLKSMCPVHLVLQHVRRLVCVVHAMARRRRGPRGRSRLVCARQGSGALSRPWVDVLGCPLVPVSYDSAKVLLGPQHASTQTMLISPIPLLVSRASIAVLAHCRRLLGPEHITQPRVCLAPQNPNTINQTFASAPFLFVVPPDCALLATMDKKVGSQTRRCAACWLYLWLGPIPTKNKKRRKQKFPSLVPPCQLPSWEFDPNKPDEKI